MVLTWFTQLGDWNPQLLRELKGRLTAQNIIVAVMTSLLVQLVTVMGFRQRLELPDNSYAVLGQTGLQIAWNVWWLDVLNVLTLEGLVLLMMLGSYLLAADLAKEAQLGTLTFLRLSPQSGRTILLGKLLGVPVLLYLAIALALPLHVWATVQTGLPWFVTVGLYLWLVTACGLVFSVALWCPLSRGSSARSWHVIFPAGILYLLFFFFLENGWSASRNVFYGIWSSHHSDAMATDLFISIISSCVFAVIMSTIASTLTLMIWRKCLEDFCRTPL